MIGCSSRATSEVLLTISHFPDHYLTTCCCCLQGSDAFLLSLSLGSSPSYAANVTITPINVAYSAQGSLTVTTVAGYWSEGVAQPLIMADMPSSVNLAADFYTTGAENMHRAHMQMQPLI